MYCMCKENNDSTTATTTRLGQYLQRKGLDYEDSSFTFKLKYSGGSPVTLHTFEIGI